MAEKIKRNYTRFKPDENTLLTILFTNDTKLIGLAYSEAYGGFAGVFIKNTLSESIEIDHVYKVSVGGIDYESSSVKWISPVDNEVIKVGFQILD